MPGFEEIKTADKMPVLPKRMEGLEDPMTDGLVEATDDKVNSLLGKKLD